MKGEVAHRDVLIKHCDANTAFVFNIVQQSGGIIKTATLLLNTEYKWYEQTGRKEIFAAVGFYAALLMESENFIDKNTLLRVNCFKIVKGNMIAHYEGENYMRHKGVFEKIKMDKHGFITFM